MDTTATGQEHVPLEERQGAWIIGHYPDGRPMFAVAGGDGSDDDDGDGGGGDGSDDDDGDGGGGDDDDDFKPVTSQDQFDRMVQDRIRRERAKYDDYDALKKKAERFDELEEAQKTDLQKAQDAQTAAEKAREDAAAELRGERTRNAVFAEASKLKVSDLDAAYRLLDLTQVEYDEEGHPKGASVKSALEALIKDRPFLTAASRPTGSGDGGPRGSESDRTDMNDLIRQRAGRGG